MNNKYVIRPYSLSFLIIFILSGAILIQSSDIHAQTQNKCDQELKEAYAKFINFKLEDAIKLVRECLDKKDITTVDKVQAHLLGGKIYFAQLDTVIAKEKFILVFESDSTFKPDPEIESPEDIALLKIAKSEFQSKVSETEEPQVVQPLRKKGGKKWFWIGSGIAIAGGLIVFFWPPPDPPEDLPGPPGPPGIP